jgi:hypothetical protein
MGADNTLRFTFRYKLPLPISSGFTRQEINVAYQKVRVRVKYGNFYLQSSGEWSTSENFITFYDKEFGKFLEKEIIAVQPVPGASSGFNLECRVYHSYIFHTEYSTPEGLRAKPTYVDDTYSAVTTYALGDRVFSSPIVYESLQAGNLNHTPITSNAWWKPVSDSRSLPVGSRSETIDGVWINYYELEETTDAESIPLIVRPNDFHSLNNPYQWVFKSRVVNTTYTNFTTPFWIDKIGCEFLTNGERSVDTIIREQIAEANNPEILEETVLHGSYAEVIKTIMQLGFGFGLFATSGASLSMSTKNVLTAKILYTGYYRDVDGVGYENWARPGVSESIPLHAIQLKTVALQYNRSWRKITGSIASRDTYITFLDVFQENFDSNRLYIPNSLRINDKMNMASGEFQEMINLTSDAGSDGSGSSPFTSGFTTGFGGGFD